MARPAAALLASAILVLLVAGAQASRRMPLTTIVTPTIGRPLTGPRVTTVGPLGGVTSTTTRLTPLNPFVGPVTTRTTVLPGGVPVQTRTAVTATPLNPFVGPVRRTVVTGVGH